MLNFGVLWINARNLLYIRKFNDKKAIRLADNKYKTKVFMTERWIPVGKTYAMIYNKEQLNEFDFSKLDSKFLVFKPNRWSKWEWIIIAEYLWSNNSSEKSDEKYFKIWWKVIEYNDFKRQLFDIFDGKYSLSWWRDSILIEEKLSPDWCFGDFCKYWLADIRVIVFNLVPVAAMVRVPTIESNWKANLKQWWVWLWLDITNWTVSSMILNWKVYSNKFPDKYADLCWKKVQYWDNILLHSSKIQFFVNLWYLALDWVITKDWPKLLEINARAGLEVQNACRLPLRTRLEKLSNTKISDPEKWIEICKSLFSSNKVNYLSDSKILYKSQEWILTIINEDSEITKTIELEIDINNKQNYLSKDLFEKIENSIWSKISFEDSWTFFSDLTFLCSKKDIANKIILWVDTVKNFYIKPTTKHKKKDISIYWITSNETQTIIALDAELQDIWKTINLSRILRPINYNDELDKFIINNWKYNPIFIYNFPSDDKLDSMLEKLQILEKTNKPDLFKSSIFKIYEEKITELIIKIKLIKAYSKQDFEEIKKYNTLLYWKTDENLVTIAKKEFFKVKMSNQISSLWKILPLKDVIIEAKNFLKINWIENIQVELSDSNISRISIKYWTNPKLTISSSSVFYEKQLYSILAHEILVHLKRHLNWEMTWLYILKNWTGLYLQDEEWLAIYNSIIYLPADYSNEWIYKKYFLLSESENYNFMELWNLAQSFNADKSLYRIFNEILRMKKWLINTSLKWIWTSYEKDKVYLSWYLKVKSWIEGWWDVNKLYLGKIKIEDIEKLHN